jgi:hypothetical protein
MSEQVHLKIGGEAQRTLVFGLVHGTRWRNAIRKASRQKTALEASRAVV